MLPTICISLDIRMTHKDQGNIHATQQSVNNEIHLKEVLCITLLYNMIVLYNTLLSLLPVCLT